MKSTNSTTNKQTNQTKNRQKNNRLKARKKKKSENLQVQRTANKKKLMLKALREQLGIVTAACKQIGISRCTHYAWIESDSAYKKKVDSMSDVVLDFAESGLFKNIKKGNVVAQIFYLKTKGKNRGYIEKQEVEMSGSMDNDIKVSVVKVIKKEEEFDGTEGNDNIPTE